MAKSLSELNTFFRENLSAKAFKLQEIKLRRKRKEEGKKAAEEAMDRMGIEAGF